MAPDLCSERSFAPLLTLVSSARVGCLFPLGAVKMFSSFGGTSFLLGSFYPGDGCESLLGSVCLSHPPCRILPGGYLLTTIHGALQCLNTQGPDIPFTTVWARFPPLTTMK